MTGLAGEFFVAAELLKRDIQVALTFGNAKAIDLIAHNRATMKSFNIQVKALRKPTDFPLSYEKVNKDCVYVFVILNKPGDQTEFYIVPGRALHKSPERFGKYFQKYAKFPGINSKYLAEFKDNWYVFQR